MEDLFTPGLVKSFYTYLHTHPKIPVVVNFPTPDLNIPNVAIISPDSNEELQFLGDHMGTEIMLASSDSVGLTGDNPGEKVIATANIIGVIDSANFRIVTTASDEILTAMLTSALRFLIFHAKFRLEQFGIFDIVLGESDFAFPQDYWPTIAWSKALRLTGRVEKALNTMPLRNTEDETIWESVSPILNQFISDLTVELSGNYTNVTQDPDEC